MTTNVLHYNKDGACPQAKATLAMFQQLLCDGIESSWNDTFKRYEAQINVARWENCREQGYVLTMRSKDYKQQLNIAFFEHRNSDEICAVRWEQVTMNSPTIDTAEFLDVYMDKFDTTYSVPYGGAVQMAKYLMLEFQTFWDKTAKIVTPYAERVTNAHKQLEAE